MEIVPGRIPELLLRQQNLGLLRADERVSDVMLDGWRAQLLARGLSTDYIKASCRTVTRFQEHTNDSSSSGTHRATRPMTTFLPGVEA